MYKIQSVFKNDVVVQDSGVTNSPEAITGGYTGGSKEPVNSLSSSTLVLGGSPTKAQAYLETTSQEPAPSRWSIPTSVIRQGNAPEDLGIVSWSRTKPLPRRLDGYVYDVNLGQDTYIYVIDHGLNGQGSVSNVAIT